MFKVFVSHYLLKQQALNITRRVLFEQIFVSFRFSMKYNNDELISMTPPTYVQNKKKCMNYFDVSMLIL